MPASIGPLAAGRKRARSPPPSASAGITGFDSVVGRLFSASCHFYCSKNKNYLNNVQVLIVQGIRLIATTLSKVDREAALYKLADACLPDGKAAQRFADFVDMPHF